MLIDFFRSKCWLERTATAAWAATCSEDVAQAKGVLADVDAHAERLQLQLHKAMDEASATVGSSDNGLGTLDLLALMQMLFHHLAQYIQVEASTNAIFGQLDGMHADVSRQVQLLGKQTAAAEASASALVERSAAQWAMLAAAIAADGADGKETVAAHAVTAADHAATAQQTLETGLSVVSTTVRSGHRRTLAWRCTTDSNIHILCAADPT